MSVRRLWLEGGGDRVSLDGPEIGVEAAGSSGFGFPEAEAHWVRGAGDGGVYRGTRHGNRVIPLTVLFRGTDPDHLQELMDRVAAILDPENAPARLVMDTAPTESWWLPVVRVGPADWDWGEQTDGASWVQVPLTLESGDPYWTRQAATAQTVTPAGSGRGLLAPGTSLTQLRLASGQAMGDVTIHNPGTARAYPVVTINGPATSLESVSPRGEVLTWAGDLGPGERRIIDHRARTITDPDDPDDPNRYDELGPAPQFWSIPRGTHVARVALEGTSNGTLEPGQVLRRNLVPDPRLQGSRWSVARATLTPLTHAGLVGARVDVTDDSGAQYAILSNASRIPVVGGTDLYVRAKVWRGTGAEGVEFGPLLYEYDGTGTLLGTSAAYQEGPDGTWDEVTAVYPLRPDTAEVRVGVSPRQALPVGAVYYATEVMASPQGGPYFDGDKANTASAIYSWEGAPGDSVSLEREAVRVGRSSVRVAWHPRRWLVI